MTSTVERALEKGVISNIDVSPFLVKCLPPRLDPKVNAIVSRVEPRRREYQERKGEQLNDPARDTKAQLYQDVGFDWIRETSNPFVYNGVYEIARFIATPGQTGIVKYCGTYAEIHNPVDPFYIELDPRDPYALSRRAINIKWILRLYQGTFQDLGPPYQGSYENIHGYGYNPLPFWTDYRFQWGRTANDVWWLVPENHALRLYAWIRNAIGAELLMALKGRLVGFTQPIRTVQTGWNVRHGW